MQRAPKHLIIPAAGMGTRMREVNPGLPKEMLPVGNNPVIQYAVEEGISAGIEHIIIIINHGKESVRSFIETHYRSSTSIAYTFLYQKEPLGESDAISYAKDSVGEDSVAVIYPDNLYVPAPGALKALISCYMKANEDVTVLTEVRPDMIHAISNAGRVDLSHIRDGLFRIEKFIPKGEGHFVPRFRGELRAGGIYICGPHLFDHIDSTRCNIHNEEFTDYPVRNSILKERGMSGYLLSGIIFDIGNPRGYEMCLNYMKDNPAHAG